MAWDERQHALLEAMGIRLWTPPAPEPRIVPLAPAPRAERVEEAGTGGPSRAPAASEPTREPAPPESARAQAIARMDWEALQGAVAACSACGLCASRRQTVFGVGHRSARWMVIGEAPGEQEDLRGEPFVGAAGQLLDAMLRALGLSRTDPEAGAAVYVANTLKCRPPGNRNPSPEELLQCRPFLMRQVALVAPRMILAMGKFAVQSLLGTEEPVGRLRGRVHRFAGVPVVVTYHPAYLLRQLGEKARAWEDLCLAASLLESDGDRGPR